MKRIEGLLATFSVQSFLEARQDTLEDGIVSLRRRSSLKPVDRRVENHPQISQISQMSENHKNICGNLSNLWMMLLKPGAFPRR
jgi:hypothetical protein